VVCRYVLIDSIADGNAKNLRVTRFAPDASETTYEMVWPDGRREKSLRAGSVSMERENNHSPEVSGHATGRYRTRLYWGFSYTKPIDAVQANVSIFALADDICNGELRREGKEHVGRCPLPGHEDRNPSCRFNAEKNVWRCPECLRSGGVVELARFAWGTTGATRLGRR
jgi:hypothetical protein